jgi:ABC-2 type transport system ATP-binding protein
VPAIETLGLTMRYRGGLFARPRPALEELSLRVEPNEVFGFLGANGAGKTTTIKLLMGLLHPTAGRAQLFGRDARDPAARRGVGYLPELPNFYEYLTGREALHFYAALAGLPRAARARAAGELLERTGLADAAETRIRGYSGGMRARLGLAQALLGEPALVILDEPMASLDPLGRHDVRRIILDLQRQGKTVFYSTHILSDVEATCTRVAVLSRGRFVAAGPLSAILAPGTKSVRLEAAGVSQELAARLEARGLVLRREGELVSLEVPGEAEVNRLVDELRAGGARILALLPHRESLEEAFVRLEAAAAAGGASAGEARR